METEKRQILLEKKPKLNNKSEKVDMRETCANILCRFFLLSLLLSLIEMYIFQPAIVCSQCKRALLEGLWKSFIYFSLTRTKMTGVNPPPRHGLN